MSELENEQEYVEAASFKGLCVCLVLCQVFRLRRCLAPHPFLLVMIRRLNLLFVKFDVGLQYYWRQHKEEAPDHENRVVKSGVQDV